MKLSAIRLAAIWLSIAAVALAGGVGRVSGFIKDTQGSPIAGAELKFHHRTQGFTRTVKTNEKGYYILSTLPYGPLHLTISAEGYRSYVEDFDFIPEMSPAVRDFKLNKARAAKAPGAAPEVIQGLNRKLAKALDDANSAMMSEDYAGAVKIYEEARKSEGDHPLVVMGLARAYLKTGNEAKAKEVLGAALKLDPVPHGAHFYLGTLLATKNKAGALEEFQAETVLTPDNDGAFYNLGATAYELHKKDLAVKALEKARSLNPDNEEAGSLLAQIYAEQGNVQKAKELAPTGGDPTALLNVGIKLYNAHKDNDALETLKKVVSIDPKKAKAWRLLGLTYVRMGKLDDAKASFKKALAADPKDAESKQMLSALGG